MGPESAYFSPGLREDLDLGLQEPSQLVLLDLEIEARLEIQPEALLVIVDDLDRVGRWAQ